MKFHSNMFGWDYVWRDFADSKGGEVVSDTTKESNPILHVFIPVEGSEASIRLTPFAIKGKTKGAGTSASLHYSPKENFAFYIRAEKGVDQIGKAFGLQDIVLGDADFDKQFLIQGTDEGKVRNLFSDMKLRELLLQNNLSELRLVVDGAHLPAGHKLPPGRHAVVYSTDKVVDKFEQLEAIYNILTQVVHRIGAIPALVGEEEVYSAQEEQEEELRQGNRLHSPLLDMA